MAHTRHLSAGSVRLMLGLWLFPQLVLVGVGEAFHFPGQVSLYYQEFPTSLRSTSTAIISLLIAISFYLSTALIDLIRRTTTWINRRRSNPQLKSEIFSGLKQVSRRLAVRGPAAHSPLQNLSCRPPSPLVPSSISLQVRSNPPPGCRLEMRNKFLFLAFEPW